jgi:predicted ATPase with chaperone activity
MQLLLFSAWAVHCILILAWVIADLADGNTIETPYLGAAIQSRPRKQT